MNGDPKKKRGKQPGAGMSGSTSRMSRSEERVLAKGLEGKIDISTQPKYIKALNAEHARTGEPKSSYVGRTKKRPVVSPTNKQGIKLLDTSTGSRISGKQKLTDAQKAKAKRTAKIAMAGMTRAEKKKYRQR